MLLFIKKRRGASLVTQKVKNLPAMRKTWVQSLGPGDPLEKGMATHSNILAFSPSGHKESDTVERLHFHFLFTVMKCYVLNYFFGLNSYVYAKPHCYDKMHAKL